MTCFIVQFLCHVLMCFIEHVMCFIEHVMCFIEHVMCFIEHVMCFIEPPCNPLCASSAPPLRFLSASCLLYLAMRFMRRMAMPRVSRLASLTIRLSLIHMSCRSVTTHLSFQVALFVRVLTYICCCKTYLLLCRDIYLLLCRYVEYR